MGVEPTSPVFQTGAVTTLATAPQWSMYLERETGFEPAASSLARRRSTTELFPQILRYYIKYLRFKLQNIFRFTLIYKDKQYYLVSVAGILFGKNQLIQI